LFKLNQLDSRIIVKLATNQNLDYNNSQTQIATIEADIEKGLGLIDRILQANRTSNILAVNCEKAADPD
jgi:hypothetical protein